MATQQATATRLAAGDEKPQNSEQSSPGAAPPMAKPIDGDNKVSQNSSEEAASESFKRSIALGLEQPMREEQVQNAVKFLSHPKVRGSPVIYRRSFLEKKGLTREEIDEAFRRVPDPPSNAASVEAVNPTQGNQQKPSTSLQPQVPTPTIQTGAVPSSIVPMAPAPQKSRFQWSHFFVAVGVLGTSGAGSALLFKNAVLPRLKAWIRKVSKEEDDDGKEEKLVPSLAEKTAEAAEAAKSAASAAAVVAKACQDLLSTRGEEKKQFEAFMGLLDAQVKEMKSMGGVISKLEAAREVTHPQEKRISDMQSVPENGPINNMPMIPLVDHSDPRGSSISAQEQKMNGTVDGSARPSSAPASIERTATPYPKSFMEIMAMVQRGETPPGIKEVNDMPPNPNQQLPNPRLAPRIKPWEATQQVPQNSYGQLQGKVDGSISEMQYNGQSSQLNGRSFDGSDPSWKRKTPTITETEDEVEEPRVSSYSIGSKNWPGRDWVPPQTPSVAMPEAAVAIRKPKPSVQKQQLVSDSTMQPNDREEETARTADSSIRVEGASDGPLELSHQSEILEEHADEGSVH
uniref:Peroxisomal membrane protein PEX14 n=1 Tax=Anthurium amnicola TaxID=1678845 RepID=A0A1D1Y414_9ARAE